MIQEPGWQEALREEWAAPYMEELRAFLASEESFYPPSAQLFNAFEQTPFDQVKAVILGQDPYHGPGQAMGLSFSVAPGCPHPPSLRNILKERESDVGLPYPVSGDLTPWAKAGVLLLNATLSVRPGEARSHSGRGWERFTQGAIEKLAAEREGIVFCLWGRDAQARAEQIDASKHLLHRSVHPSPLSAHRGFFGSRPFSTANSYLASQGVAPIDWSL